LAEIEAAVLTRARSLADPELPTDPTYLDGLRGSVSVGLCHALAGIEAADPEPAPVPAELLSQARAAARAGVSLDTVLRRYVAGHALLADFLIAEAENCSEPLPYELLKGLLAVQAALLDRLIAEVSEEYGREACRRERSKERRRAECAARLLAGELADASELAYELQAHHTAAIATGAQAEQAIRSLARRLDRRLLLIRRGEEPLWAWLGGTQALATERLVTALEEWPDQALLALGECAPGLDGWRLSHRQATAALSVARKGRSPVHYREVALLAAALSDDVLGASLRQLYLAPLESERDGGVSAKATLRAYFAAERNASSAAAVLGVSRNTVTARLRAIEERIGCRLDACLAELEVALRLDERGVAATVRTMPLGR